METVTIATSTYVLMAIGSLFAIALPLGAVLYWRKKTHARILPFVIGAVIFLVFTQVLEATMHYFCLASDNAVSRVILGSTVLYALYGAFAAGIFEETGRYFAFRVLLRKYPEREISVSYGIGHGGIEVLVVLGAMMGMNLVAALLYQKGGIAAMLPLTGSEETAQIALAQIAGYTPGILLMAMLERVWALLFHIAMSIYVFIAARNRDKRWYYPLAILLHVLLDLPVAFYQRGVLPLWAIEIWAGVFSLYLLRAARKRYLEQADV